MTEQTAPRTSVKHTLPVDGDISLAVIGLGYVGLPLAVEFGKQRRVIGFDIDGDRIDALKAGHDTTLEVSPEELSAATGLTFTTDPGDLVACNVYIVTVPTPIDEHKRPDLTPLRKASELIGKVLKAGDIVIYESTVYPGCTEEDCAPILEKHSNLQYCNCQTAALPAPSTLPLAPNTLPLTPCPLHPKAFYLGYSPERINPGDKNHRLPGITKVTSGSTPAVAEFVDRLYGGIITAGTHRASSIRVAEAAKVIENTQRDLNIALVNELAMIFSRMGIDTEEVLLAAGTKWNFLPFRPGLVGGHCIGVDPYYLTHKAQAIGYHPEIILAGRRINDGMGRFVAGELVKAMLHREIPVKGARVLVMGITFKENCPDIRNTRVIDVVNELRDFHIEVDIHDPWANPQEAQAAYGIHLTPEPQPGSYDAIVLAVGHSQFRGMGADSIRRLGRNPHVLYDLKYLLPPGDSDIRL